MKIKIEFELTANPGHECRAMAYVFDKYFVESATTWGEAEAKLIERIKVIKDVVVPSNKEVEIE